MPQVTHNYYNMVILINNKEYGINRDQLHEELKRYNIITRKYFYPLCSQFQCYRRHSSASSDNLPVAESISEKVLSLPLYGDLVPEDINLICDILDYIGKKSRKRIVNLHRERKMEQGNAPLRIPAS
jgi:dTDP-4-amino-4,6-dideoxygalactose transaminase